MTNYDLIPSNQVTTVSVVDVSRSQNGNAFFNASVEAYGNLSSKPLAMFLLILASLAIIAENNNTSGPFEIIAKTLEAYIADPKHSAFIKTLATLLLGIVNFIIKFKAHMFLYILILVIALAYPDSNTFYVCFFLFIYVSVSSHGPYLLFIIIQLFFIYFNQRDNFSRIVISLIIIVLAFGTEAMTEMLTEKKPGE